MVALLEDFTFLARVVVYMTLLAFFVAVTHNAASSAVHIRICAGACFTYIRTVAVAAHPVEYFVV